MKTLDVKKSIGEVSGKSNSSGGVCITLLFLIMILTDSAAYAQAVMFNFDDAPIHTSLPIDLTANGITAHFSATGQGYSIQEANTMGFAPLGFAGLCIYPNSVYSADLLISFDQALTDFSIMYACQELGCDDAATMRVTAYMNSSLAGTNTRTATNPGTWPTDTLRFSFTQGFNSVVVHYDSRPPTCQDYGVIFMADNMQVTPYVATLREDLKIFIKDIIIPNPVSQSAIISFSLFQPGHINITIYDISGKLIEKLFDGHANTGQNQVKWILNDNSEKSGMYYLKVTGENFSRTCKLVVMKQ